MATLDLIKINKIYPNGVQAVFDFNLHIDDQEFIIFVGPSGCGKSTLLSILSDIEKESSGKIIKHQNLKTGYMLQTDSLFPWLTIKNNALLPLTIKKELTNDNINKVINLFNRYGLQEFTELYPKNLSGGMRQRVG